MSTFGISLRCILDTGMSIYQSTYNPPFKWLQNQTPLPSCNPTSKRTPDSIQSHNVTKTWGRETPKPEEPVTLWLLTPVFFTQSSENQTQPFADVWRIPKLGLVLSADETLPAWGRDCGYNILRII